jgi:uncharacterized protein YybS (DUF2232 family)
MLKENRKKVLDCNLINFIQSNKLDFIIILCSVILFYLQSVQVHSVNCVKIYTMACKKSALLKLIGTKFIVACGKETSKLSLKD